MRMCLDAQPWHAATLSQQMVIHTKKFWAEVSPVKPRQMTAFEVTKSPLCAAFLACSPCKA